MNTLMNSWQKEKPEPAIKSHLGFIKIVPEEHGHMREVICSCIVHYDIMLLKRNHQNKVQSYCSSK